MADVDLKFETGSSVGLSLDMRSTRVHSRRLTTVLITDTAKRWEMSSVYMSLPLTKGYLLLALWADKAMLEASQGKKSGVNFIDIILLINAAVKGAGGDLKWGEGEREKKEPGVKLSV